MCRGTTKGTDVRAAVGPSRALAQISSSGPHRRRRGGVHCRDLRHQQGHRRRAQLLDLWNRQHVGADRPTSDGDPRRPDGAGRPRPRGHVNETIALLWKRPMRLCSPSNKIVISLRSPSNEEDQAHMRLCNQHGAATEATCIYRASAAPSAQTPSRGQT